MGKKPVHLISCGVFRAALEHLELDRRYPELTVDLLPAKLHLYPHELERRLTKALQAVRRGDARVICLYGQCFRGMDAYCSRENLVRVPGAHCFEILLGPERYGRIIEETAGTYFLERELVENFEEYCYKPLELHDPAMRRAFFEHYLRLLYVRQPKDPNLLPQLRELARLLELRLDIRDADYGYLEAELDRLIRGGPKTR